jgi:hypothetical protein
MHLDPSQETLMGVTVGALLASLGGLLAGRVEQHLRRREREQSAAMLFGEILAALQLILRLADESRGRGDPYGPITLRFLMAAQRETEIYDRNRETLFDLRDAELRARTHLVLLQLILTLDAVFETNQTVRATPPGEEAPAEVIAARAGAFDFLLELRELMPDLLSSYKRIARHTFDAHDTAARQSLGPRPGGGGGGNAVP